MGLPPSRVPSKETLIKAILVARSPVRPMEPAGVGKDDGVPPFDATYSRRTVGYGPGRPGSRNTVRGPRWRP